MTEDRHETHEGWDLSGEPATHQGQREACWDPACELTENHFALNDILDIEAGLQEVLDRAKEA